MIKFVDICQPRLLYTSPDEGEKVVLAVYTDASYGPDSSESHGSIAIMAGKSLLFWKSGRQAMVTLSTAESELVEVVEGMIGGESVHVILSELDDMPKIAYTDSQSALAVFSTSSFICPSVHPTRRMGDSTHPRC